MAIPQVYIDAVTEQLGVSVYLDFYSHPSDAHVEWHSIHAMDDGTFVLYSEDGLGSRRYIHSVHPKSVDNWREFFLDLAEYDRAHGWEDDLQ